MNTIKVLVFSLLLFYGVKLSAQTVCITKSGEKYHKSSCKYLKYSKKEITLKKAIELGYKACSVCRPTQKSEELSSTTKNKITSNKSKKTTKETSKKVESVQCSGKTNSGSRCKRMTKNSNGRCYQH